MAIRPEIRRLLPDPIVRAGKRLVGIDPFPPFRLREDAAVAARSRYEALSWPGAGPRIIYALTPTAQLRNVGDQAQVVAINRWLARHWPGRPIVELDKDMVLACADDLERRIGPSDMIFLHSGGNMGDRGLWSETARRTVISRFPGNRVVSLPQTIFFSETPRGRHERENTRRIYAGHPQLIVVGRDRVSGDIAEKLFPAARVTTAPDFVLSLSADEFDLTPDPTLSDHVIACLRVDDESIFSAEERVGLASSLGRPTTLYDTTLDHDIPAAEREAVVTRTLSLFASHEAVVTDRFHGLIFSVICRKPTVVLRTVDHKLTSALEWFREIPNVIFCEDRSEVVPALARAMSTPVERYPDFNALYFDRLPELVALSAKA